MAEEKTGGEVQLQYNRRREERSRWYKVSISDDLMGGWLDGLTGC